MEEEITVILVESADIAAFLGDLFAQFFVQDVQVIDISFMDTQDQAQDRVGVLGISFPADVAEIIFCPFIDFDGDVHLATLVEILCILYDRCITIAFFVVLFDLSLSVWALVIRIFTRRAAFPNSALWRYSMLAAGWSLLLDVAGVALAMIAPGKVSFC